eukprot:scaffold101887_cov62-Cyclotella_meneghiniana.AAC.4
MVGEDCDWYMSSIMVTTTCFSVTGGVKFGLPAFHLSFIMPALRFLLERFVSIENLRRDCQMRSPSHLVGIILCDL